MATRFRIHLLDMGNKDYGDCIVIEAGDTRILIDGGHPGDERSRTGFRSIPRQMTTILGQEAPFQFNLLVMTHCHNDHIGCLPEMIANGTIQATWALVADPNLGWGISNDGIDPFEAANPILDRALAGLREEPPQQLSEDELADFLDDVVRLKDRYRTMLDNLTAVGTNVVRCGRDDITPILDEFESIGLSYLGPSAAHLALCTEAIHGFGRDTRDSLADAMSADAAMSAVDLYRELLASNSDAQDRRGIGAALNDQSIILALEIEGKRALFTGDMQFAEPEVTGLDDEMQSLREIVAGLAPYQFVKLAHHASYNAFDASVLEQLGETDCLGISTGKGDEGHPDRSVLEILRANRHELRWARTDRNGLITFDLSGATPQITCQRGTVNNSRINTDAVNVEGEEEGGGARTPEEPPAGNAGRPANTQRRTRVARVESADGNFVEVTAKVPHVATRVTLTIEVEPQAAAPPQAAPKPPPRKKTPIAPGPRNEPAPDPSGPFRLGGGRTLPPLLFATNRGRLLQNIDATAVAQIIAGLSSAGHTVVDSLPYDLAGATSAVRAKLAQNPALQGVVLLGGYDVVPPQKFDTLDPALRAQVGATADEDNFIVWSDAVYGNNDNDIEQEVPVTRIPDGHSAALMLAALQARPPVSTAAFGIRNLRRPFAQLIWNKFATGTLPSCTPLLVTGVNPAQVHAAGRLYFMLHGDDSDTTKFWGESEGGGYPEAFNIGRVPAHAPAVLLTGCCWGALTSPVTARAHVDGQPIPGHTATTSLALAFLRAGTQAFIGCTGTHYSPTVQPYGYFGGPMHEAFWKNVLPAPGGQGMPPARALWEAKRTYLQGMPHGQTSPLAVAIEMKIYHQFQCLGLGW